MNTQKNKIILIMSVVTILTTLFVSGCGATTDQTSARQMRINNNSLVVAIGAEPEMGFDTTTGGHGSITRVLFSTLFKRDENLSWSNDLATGYFVSEDRLTWTVTLREDAFFTDGMPVTAEDVAYTYETAKSSASEIDLTIIKHIEVIDAHTIAFTLQRMYSPFLERLAYLGIVPKHAHSDTFKDAPVGSGPYKLTQWDKGQQAIFEANDGYYGDKAKINQLTMVFLEQDAAFSAVKNGSVDVALMNGTLAEQKVDGAQIVDLDSIECYGISFPMIPNKGERAEDGAIMGNDVTSDIAIRKALNTAIDRTRIVEGVLNGYGRVSTTGLEKMPWLNTETVLDSSEYGDEASAIRILAEAGWVDTDGDGIVEKNGLKAAFNLLYTDGIYRQEMALEFSSVAKNIGIEVTLKQTTWDTILEDIHRDAVFYGFGSGDPSELYNLYYGGNAGGVVPWDNSGCYDNAFVNENIDMALNAMDENDAIPYWKALQISTSAKGDAPYVWLANANHVYLVADDFSFENPVVQPHGGRIFDNVAQWYWRK